MASSIGTFYFGKMTGPQIPSLAASVQIIDRPGTDGTVSRVNALKAEEVTKFTLEGVQLLATANARADAYAALKGYHVTVVDDLGRIVYQVLVIDVRVTRVQRVLAASVPTTNYIVYATWLLKPTAMASW